ncbi:MAG: hypothetical protein ACRD5K_09425 [Candidatus Acidiferrales bacterium]
MKFSYKPMKTGFRVRLMSPLGRYPAQSFCTERAALITSPELCFSIVRSEEEDRGFSEVDCLRPLELPLLGSILLGGESGEPYMYPYPTYHSVELATESLELIDDRNIRRCKSLLLRNIQRHFKSGQGDRLHRPAIIGGERYDLVSTAPVEGDRLRILCRLESANAVTLRGVNCLLKARMAFGHHELAEAGRIFLWIALDAAYSIILRELRRGGIQNPTSKDAARYFERVSGYGSDAERFFEDDYANRIRAIHPDNRFGPEIVPQFLADDFLELNDMLIPLFEYLVSEVDIQIEEPVDSDED